MRFSTVFMLSIEFLSVSILSILFLFEIVSRYLIFNLCLCCACCKEGNNYKKEYPARIPRQNPAPDVPRQNPAPDVPRQNPAPDVPRQNPAPDSRQMSRARIPRQIPARCPASESRASMPGIIFYILFNI
jgi:hypothetical protein